MRSLPDQETLTKAVSVPIWPRLGHRFHLEGSVGLVGSVGNFGR